MAIRKNYMHQQINEWYRKSFTYDENLYLEKCIFGLIITAVRKLVHYSLKTSPHAKSSLKLDKKC
jgi:hypothetical protein